MKITPIAVAVATILSVGPTTALWADSTSTKNDSNMESQPTRNPSTANIKLKDYVGMDVIASNGDSVGEIEKLVTYHNDNTVVYAVVNVGGFLDFGDEKAAIPINQLRAQGDKWVLSSSITKDSLKNKMKYEKSEFSAFEPTD